MLNRLDLRGAPDAPLPRPRMDGSEPLQAVREILADVRARGDVALRDLTRRFDGADRTDLLVSSAERAAALARIPDDVLGALEAALDAITAYHRTQVRAPLTHRQNGIEIDSYSQPVDRAGLYVPGGLAAYPSTVLMTAGPASVAGVSDLALCVPPGPDGQVADVTLAAAELAGVGEVFAVGGAQAIAAMAFGTETIRPVDTIAGPGNVYVAVAKREVAGTVGIPSAFAGPSEVVVIADATAPVDYAAIDLIVQAEHGPDGLSWLITWDDAVADAVCDRLSDLVAEAPRRAEISSTLAEGGYAVVVDGPDEAAAVANRIAPEHLEVMVDGPDRVTSLVRHAGAVFVGPWAPASLGDYAAGPSHVLPTYRTARFGSALTVDDFVKHMHVVRGGLEGLQTIGPWVETLADAEGLPAHAASVRMRLDDAKRAGGPLR